MIRVRILYMKLQLMIWWIYVCVCKIGDNVRFGDNIYVLSLLLNTMMPTNTNGNTNMCNYNL